MGKDYDAPQTTSPIPPGKNKELSITNEAVPPIQAKQGIGSKRKQKGGNGTTPVKKKKTWLHQPRSGGNGTLAMA